MAALQWTALSDDDTTIAAGMLDDGARGVADYIERMRQYIVPMQSMVIADADGHIGLIAPGRVPVRDPATRLRDACRCRAGTPPRWKGYLKFEDLPRFIDGRGGRDRHRQCAHRAVATIRTSSPTTGMRRSASSASGS